MRTCKYKDKNYLFHCWEHYSEIIEPSPMVGGHGGGVIGCTFAIVEDEEGHVFRVHPYEIHFTDGLSTKQSEEIIKEMNNIERKE